MKVLALILLFALGGCFSTKSPEAPGEPLRTGGRPPAPRGDLSGTGGGTDFGGGTETGTRTRFAHWFPQKRKIAVCLRRAENFAVKLPELEAQVQSAFQTWNQYLWNNDPELHELSVEPFLVPCSKATDVEFLFGVEDDRVRNSKRRYHDPFGMATAEKGKGIIWLAPQGTPTSPGPNWTRTGYLGAILLHEVGHLFGNEHVEGTIMAADLGESLEELPQTWLNRIDHSRQLLACLTCSRRYSVIVGTDHEGRDFDQIEALKRVSGDASSRTWQLNFETLPTRKIDNLVLEIVSDYGRRRLSTVLAERLDVSVFTSGAKVFLHSGLDGTLNYLLSTAHEFRNSWVADEGSKWEIIYGVNTASVDNGLYQNTYPARLQLLQEGKRVTLVNFSSQNLVLDNEDAR